MDSQSREVEARRIYISLPSLPRVIYFESQVLCGVVGRLSKHVAHTRDHVTMMAAKIVIWVVRRARACRWITSEPRGAPTRQHLAQVCGGELCGPIREVARGGLQRARKRIVLARPIVEGAVARKLGQPAHQPRARAVVRLEIVVARSVGEGGVALGTVAAARPAACVLDGEHRHAWLYPARMLTRARLRRMVESSVMMRWWCGYSVGGDIKRGRARTHAHAHMRMRTQLHAHATRTRHNTPGGQSHAHSAVRAPRTEHGGD